MKITFVRMNGKYVVTVADLPHIFKTSLDALEFIFYLRKEVA